MKLLGLLAFVSTLFIISAKLSNGEYFIKSQKFGTYWDTCNLDAHCPADPDNLFVNTFFGDDFQTFAVTRLYNGYYTITAVINGKNAAAKNAHDSSDTIFLAKSKKNDRQQFKLIQRKDGSYLIQPRKLENKAIEAPKKAGKELFLDKKNKYADEQHFVFEPVVTILADPSIKSNVASLIIARRSV